MADRRARPRGFDDNFRCYSIKSATTQTSAHTGGRIILPPSALLKLSSMEVSYPMLFELRNDAAKRRTHAGVMQFTAEEGRAYLPPWVAFPRARPRVCAR